MKSKTYKAYPLSDVAGLGADDDENIVDYETLRDNIMGVYEAIRDNPALVTGKYPTTKRISDYFNNYMLASYQRY